MLQSSTPAFTNSLTPFAIAVSTREPARPLRCLVTRGKPRFEALAAREVRKALVDVVREALAEAVREGV